MMSIRETYFFTWAMNLYKKSMVTISIELNGRTNLFNEYAHELQSM